MCSVAVQHADGGYFRHKRFGSSPIRSVVLIYSPHGSKSGEFKGIGSTWGLKVVKSCSQGALSIHFFRHFYLLATTTAL